MTLSDEVIAEIRATMEKTFQQDSMVFRLFEHISETKKRCACLSLPEPEKDIGELLKAAHDLTEDTMCHDMGRPCPPIGCVCKKRESLKRRFVPFEETWELQKGAVRKK